MIKNLIVYLVVFLAIVTIIIVFNQKEFINKLDVEVSNMEDSAMKEPNDEFTEQELDDMNYADGKIKQLMQNEEYIKLNIEDKEYKMKQTLDELQQNGYIKDYSYDTAHKIFSYEYSNGILGGTMLTDFNPELN